MSDAPPPLAYRPCWNAATIVDPKANVSGSTSVACWLSGLVNGSELIWTRATLAWAAGAPIQVARQEATVRASAAVSVRFMERLLLTLDWEREHSLPGGLVAERPEGKSTNGAPTLRSACTVFTDPQRFRKRKKRY